MNGTIIDDFLLQKKLEGVKSSTIANYSYKLESSIIPCLNNGFQTTEKDLYNTVSQKQEQLKNKTYIDFIVLLNDFLTYLHNRNYMSKLIQLPCPKIKKQKIVIFSESEKQRLEEYLIDNLDYFNFGVLLALYTGIRIGELSACKNWWVDCNGILYVKKTLQRVKDLTPNAKTKTKIIITDPKTETSIRDIPLPNWLYELYLKLPNKNENAYLLTNTNEFIEPRTIERKFEKILRLCKVIKKKFHVLRHTFATNCVRLGMDIKTLAELLGHSSIKITLDRYVHSDIMIKQESMQRLKPTRKSR